MSKKSNLTTLRKEQTDLKLIEVNTYNYLKFLNYLKIFRFFLQKKHFWAVNLFLNITYNICKFYLTIFISTKKTRNYKSKFKVKNEKSKILNLQNLANFFKITFKKSISLLHITILNKKINNSFLKNLYEKTKQYKSALFQRRFNLYFDILKIVTLFSEKMINTKYLVFLFSQVFKYLSKKLHNKFLTFLETIIYSLIYNPISHDRRAKNSLGKLKGIKFRINGKLKGKMRASTYLITYGNIPNQSIDKNIEYGLVHTFTRYGAFGLQAWVFK